MTVAVEIKRIEQKLERENLLLRLKMELSEFLRVNIVVKSVIDQMQTVISKPAVPDPEKLDYQLCVLNQQVKRLTFNQMRLQHELLQLGFRDVFASPNPAEEIKSSINVEPGTATEEPSAAPEQDSSSEQPSTDSREDHLSRIKRLLAEAEDSKDRENLDFYSCPECGKRVSSRHSFQRHLRLHMGVRPYQCEFPKCGKNFPERSTLERHHRTHTGERPFRCDHPGCPKSFADASNLRRHRAIHTGYKPYRCQCGRLFSRKISLRKHFKAIHTECN